jgi:hypothetical protein
MRILLVLILSMCPVFISYAQMRADGKWHFPDSVESLCINIEQSMVASFRSLIERNREWVDGGLKSADEHLKIAAALNKAIANYEVSWDRLGCVYIVYGAKR